MGRDALVQNRYGTIAVHVEKCKGKLYILAFKVIALCYQSDKTITMLMTLLCG